MSRSVVTAWKEVKLTLLAGMLMGAGAPSKFRVFARSGLMEMHLGNINRDSNWIAREYLAGLLLRN